MKDNNIYDILKDITTLDITGKNKNYEKRVSIISWNSGEPIIDIRTWNTDTGYSDRKGIRRDEIEAVIDALRAADIWFSSGEIDRIQRQPRTRGSGITVLDEVRAKHASEHRDATGASGSR